MMKRPSYSDRVIVSHTNEKQQALKRKRRWLLLGFSLLALLLLSFLFYPFLLKKMATHLIVADQLKPADLIVVLGGDNNGERVAQAVNLYNKGYAQKLLMTGGPLAWQLTVAEVMKRQARVFGVRSEDIMIEDKSESTLENAKFSLPLVESIGAETIIVVTSPVHTRRTKRVFSKIFKKRGIEVLVYPVQNSRFKADQWWTRHEDSQQVLWEYAASAFYFLKGY